MEILKQAREELKRADHLLYVSLKYTRTVDVIKSIILRLISGLGFSIDTLLYKAKERKLLREVPDQAGLKCELVKKLYPDESVADMVNMYLMLRKISKAEYKKSNEYRRHVTMTATTDQGIITINLDVIKDYYNRAVAYTNHVEDLLYPKKD
ncbi:hypothetical protein HY640_04865 [Candidatus Woesearchaeota archaeon]|nr:hypothetical protein [Candidatus Woesearchaeota archaeon]